MVYRRITSKLTLLRIYSKYSPIVEFREDRKSRVELTWNAPYAVYWRNICNQYFGDLDLKENTEDAEEITVNVLVDDFITKSSKTTKRSRNVFYMDGFAYFANKMTANVRYLKCSKYKALKCRATVIIPAEEPPRQNGGHNHPPDFTLESQMKFRNTLKEAAQIMWNQTPAEIYKAATEIHRDKVGWIPLEKVREQIRNYAKKAREAHEMFF